SLTSMLMDIHEVLQFVDKVVYAKTGKRLNDLQRGIIEGTLKQQKYTEIADTYRLTQGHVKDVGYELLQMLSNAFDEPVDKGNLKSVLERQGNLNISDCTFGNSNIIGYINVCSDRPTATQIKISLKLLTFSRQRMKPRLKQLVSYGSLA
ncbi:hypothetical protein WME70_32950, partial [Microcoleus anatoxicus PTRS1]